MNTNKLPRKRLTIPRTEQSQIYIYDDNSLADEQILWNFVYAIMPRVEISSLQILVGSYIIYNA